MTIAIVGGGICGLSLALNLHARGIACRVYEAAPELKELGVGITLLPHAMRELSALGLGDELLARRHRERRELLLQPLRPAHLQGAARQGAPAISIRKSASIAAGCISRSIAPCRSGIGQDCVVTNHLCTGVEQDESGARAVVQGDDQRHARCRRSQPTS